MDTILNKIKNGGITHNGTFHADDVLSTCLLRLINPDFTYQRTCEIPEDFCGIVYDVGGGEFDHHNEIKKRENGKNYAAFGLLWKALGSHFLDKEHADLFDDVFVSEIDRCDTTSNTNLLSSSIEYFNPEWNSIKKADEVFEDTVNLFTPMLAALIDHFTHSTFIPRFCKTMQEDIIFAFMNIGKQKKDDYYATAIEAWNQRYKDFYQNNDNDLFVKTFLGQVNKTYGKYKTSPFVLGMSVMIRKKRINLLEKMILERINSINALEPAKIECKRVYDESARKDILFFDNYVPNNYLSEHCEQTKVIVFPSERGGYNLLSLEKNEQEKTKSHNKSISERRFYFPELLRGKSQEQLREYDNGLLFVHQAGFLATCKTLDDASRFYEKIKET